MECLQDVPEYLVKITKFSTSVRQAGEYSKIIYDMFVRRELIKISEQTIDSAKLNELDTNGQTIIENSERLLFDLAEKGSFNSSLIKFDEAMKQTIEMASAAYKIIFVMCFIRSWLSCSVCEIEISKLSRTDNIFTNVVLPAPDGDDKIIITPSFFEGMKYTS